MYTHPTRFGKTCRMCIVFLLLIPPFLPIFASESINNSAYVRKNSINRIQHECPCGLWASANPRNSSSAPADVGRPVGHKQQATQVTRPAPVRHPRRPYLIYMVAARRVHPHPLGRQRHRRLSDLRRRRRAVLRPATDPLRQLYAAAIQRHVPVYRND